MSAPLLEVKDLAVHYGAVQALHGVSLSVAPGEVVALIGANGAGKTTTLKAVSGMLRASGGTVTLAGEKTGGLKSHELVGRGLAHAPEGRGIFLNLSVLDNVRIACHARGHGPLWQSLALTSGHFEREAAMTARAGELLEVMGLADRADETARNLPYGLQRRL